MTYGGKDNRGPSIAELQRYIREKVVMIFMLNTGEEVIGTLRWFDEHAFSLGVEGEQPFTILRSAVVGYRRKSGAASPQAPAAAKKEEPVKAAESAPPAEVAAEQPAKEPAAESAAE